MELTTQEANGVMVVGFEGKLDTNTCPDAEVHLKIFAQLARKIMHEAFRQELREFEDAENLVKYLEGALELALPAK